MLNLFIAALGGLAVGLERQWSGHASGPNARFGGLRTFTLIGLTAGVAGWWVAEGLEGPASVLLAGLVAIIGLAYYSAARVDVEATTEIAALVVVTAGTLAGMGQLAVASSITAVTMLLLVEKSRLHRWAERVASVELLAGARFAVMATVVLPLLPAEPLGPFGPLAAINLRTLWALVLFFSGLSFIGYLARRAFGGQRGYAIAGAVGGLLSSTSVTLTFSRLSGLQPDAGRALAAGVMGANLMLFPRVLLATTVLAPALAGALWPAFLAPIAVGLLLLARGVGSAEEAPSPTDDRNPLQVGAALQMAVIFQLVLWAVAIADRWFGDLGLYGSAAVLGLSDVDALTVSMAARVAADTPAAVGAIALTIGVLANTLVKATMALGLGRGAYRYYAGAGLLLMAGTLGLWLIWSL
jgi:uncharacterized membrane protein (DUF4010 family)